MWYPNPGRLWETIERLKINVFATGPSLYRTLAKHGDEWVQKYDRSSLKMLLIGSEPVYDQDRKWIFEVVGEKRIRINEIWGSTEFGGICTVYPCSDDDTFTLKDEYLRPMFGLNLVLLDELGNEICSHEKTGNLCLKTPWPGMGRTLINDHEKYLDTYFRVFPG